MVDRPARDKLIGHLRGILDGEAGLDSLQRERVETEDESVLIIAEQTLQNRSRLPLGAADDLNRPSPQAAAEIERALLLLQSDEEMAPPPWHWLERLVFVSMIIFVSGAVIDMIAQDRLVPAVARPMRFITLIAGGVLALRLLASYIVRLALAGIHIYQVRVLKRTLTDLDPQSAWPFASMEEAKRAAALTRTAPVQP